MPMTIHRTAERLSDRRDDAPKERCRHLSSGLYQKSPAIRRSEPANRYLGYLKTDQRRDAVLKALEEMDDHYLRLTEYLLQKTQSTSPWWSSPRSIPRSISLAYIDATHPQHDAAGATKYGEAILQVYQRIDDIIGKLTAALPEETIVMLMSDHGFRRPVAGFCTSIASGQSGVIKAFDEALASSPSAVRQAIKRTPC
jgi:hypothetical protein